MSWDGWHVAYDEDGNPYDTVTGQRLQVLSLEELLEEARGRRMRPPRELRGDCRFCRRPLSHSAGHTSCVGCGAAFPDYSRTAADDRPQPTPPSSGGTVRRG